MPILDLETHELLKNKSKRIWEEKYYLAREHEQYRGLRKKKKEKGKNWKLCIEMKDFGRRKKKGNHLGVIMSWSNMKGSLGSGSLALVILNIRGECARKKLRVKAILKCWNEINHEVLLGRWNERKVHEFAAALVVVGLLILHERARHRKGRRRRRRYIEMVTSWRRRRKR